MLMADQLRRDVLGCYGGTHGASPNLDRLSAGAIRFDAHTINCPLCVPSRLSMLTGTYPHVNGAIVNGWDQAERTHGTCRGTPTLYESLAEAGYRVEHMGVDHLRCDPPLADRHQRIRLSASPGEHGRGLRERSMTVDLSACRSPAVDYVDGKAVTRMYSNARTQRWPHPAGEFLDCWLADRMVELVDGADPDEPLALMGRFWSPHPPLSCPEPYFSMYDPAELDLPETVGRWYPGQSPMQLINLPGCAGAGVSLGEWRKAWAVYLGMVKLVDECLGRVIEALKRRGMWDDALVIFTSDHGEMLGSHGLYQKMCMYEESLRVPLLIKKYIKQNAKVVAFNVDPLFNDAIDGLMYIRIADLPESTVKPVLEEFQKELEKKVEDK
ncbi:hypothetical protein LCGC14_1879760 [marine sediment metagenome]|uniref:Sulfatase N-terminal domain-containing protein n=1 Tax=marine sediment metagenome TaxID=412755 RepID=A0A0F9J148_9ZZZZ